MRRKDDKDFVSMKYIFLDFDNILNRLYARILPK